MSRLTQLVRFILVMGALPAPVAIAESIPLHQDGGVLKVDVVLNDKLTLPFIIDTGASDVSITGDVFLVLQRMGLVSAADIIGYSVYTLADGSKQQEPNFRLRSLRIGGRVVQNVDCSVAPARADLLLGESFLMRLPHWSIDYPAHALVIGESATPPSPNVFMPGKAEVSDPDPVCVNAQTACREGTNMCGVYQREFMTAGQLCSGVTEAEPPGVVHTDPPRQSVNSDIYWDRICGAALQACKEGSSECDHDRRLLRENDKTCHGITAP